MFVTMGEICKWAGTNPAERKFVEGERILQAGHVTNFEKSVAENGHVSFTALCSQTKNIRLAPHAIKGEVNSEGTITSCTCSCKAELAAKCTHIVAVLLHCYHDKMDILSCTDKECEWKKKQMEVMGHYDPTPLLEHECFSSISAPNKFLLQLTEDEEREDIENTKLRNETAASSSTVECKKEEIALSTTQRDAILNIMFSNLPQSALNEHRVGRSTVVTFKTEPTESNYEIDF